MLTLSATATNLSLRVVFVIAGFVGAVGRSFYKIATIAHKISSVIETNGTLTNIGNEND